MQCDKNDLKTLLVILHLKSQLNVVEWQKIYFYFQLTSVNSCFLTNLYFFSGQLKILIIHLLYQVCTLSEGSVRTCAFPSPKPRQKRKKKKKIYLQPILHNIFVSTCYILTANVIQRCIIMLPTRTPNFIRQQGWTEYTLERLTSNPGSVERMSCRTTHNDSVSRRKSPSKRKGCDAVQMADSSLY